MQQALVAFLLIMIPAHPGHIRPVGFPATGKRDNVIIVLRGTLTSRDGARVGLDDLQVVFCCPVGTPVGTPPFPVALAFCRMLLRSALNHIDPPGKDEYSSSLLVTEDTGPGSFTFPEIMPAKTQLVFRAENAHTLFYLFPGSAP